MALINCSECSAQISSTAKHCPKCGAPNIIEQPTKQSVAEEVIPEIIATEQEPFTKKKNSDTKIILISFGITLLLGGAITFYIKNQGPNAEELLAKEKVIQDSLKAITLKEKARQDSVSAVDTFFENADSKTGNITEQRVKDAYLLNQNRIAGNDRNCWPVTVLIGDLNGDGFNDGLVKFACGFKGNAGNASAGSGLAVFINRNGNLEFLLSDEKYMIVPSKILKDGAILGEQLEYAAGDNPNWPSLKTKKQIRLKNNILVYSNVNSQSSSVKEKTAEELRQELYQLESGNPLSYLRDDTKWRKNIVGNIVVEGRVYNNATIVGFTDIDMKVTYLASNGVETDTKWFHLGYIKPGGSLYFKREFGKSGYKTASIRCEVVGAKPYSYH